MFEASGSHGELLADWHHAANIRGWRLAKREAFLCDSVSILQGTLERCDPFWLPRADRVVLQLGQGHWSWTSVQVESLMPLEIWLQGSPIARR